MNNIKKTILHGITFWITVSITILWCFLSYAAWTSITTKTTGTAITEAIWNEIVNNINTIWSTYAPTGMISAFNLSTCPTGRIPANGTNGTPDLRGEFIRWLDSGRWVDTGRTLASAQNPTRIRSLVDNYLNYSVWTFVVSAWNIETEWWSAVVPEWTLSSNATLNNGYRYTAPWTLNNGSGDNWAFATRPRNVALLYCVKQ